MNHKSQTARLESGIEIRRRGESGFTFMELLIVMVIISILATVAIPLFIKHLQNAKEVTLKQDLAAMRRAIDFYTTDKEKAPATLQDLVSAGYLREIPKDPVCGECTWNEVPAPADLNNNSGGGVGDVKSTAPGADLNGKPYSDY